MTVKSSTSHSCKQDAFARQPVETGRFPSVGAALQQGLELLRVRFENDGLELEALRNLLLERRSGKLCLMMIWSSPFPAQRPTSTPDMAHDVVFAADARCDFTLVSDFLGGSHVGFGDDAETAMMRAETRVQSIRSKVRVAAFELCRTRWNWLRVGATPAFAMILCMIWRSVYPCIRHRAVALARRAETAERLPLSQTEIARQPAAPFVRDAFAGKVQAGPTYAPTSIVERVLAGGFPALRVRSDPARRRAWLINWDQSSSSRDVLNIAELAKAVMRRGLIDHAVIATGQLLNPCDLGQGVGVDARMIDRWLQLIEHVFLSAQLRP